MLTPEQSRVAGIATAAVEERAETSPLEATATIEPAAVRLARVGSSGQFENLREASRRLVVVVPVSLALIFVMLFLTLGSGGPAALIYLNVPLALTGGVLALALRGMPVQKPLATVVIGGLVRSTLLTLLVVPTVYSCRSGTAAPASSGANDGVGPESHPRAAATKEVSP